MSLFNEETQKQLAEIGKKYLEDLMDKIHPKCEDCGEKLPATWVKYEFISENKKCETCIRKDKIRKALNPTIYEKIKETFRSLFQRS